jgi:hypothetical protein
VTENPTRLPVIDEQLRRVFAFPIMKAFMTSKEETRIYVLREITFKTSKRKKNIDNEAYIAVTLRVRGNLYLDNIVFYRRLLGNV